LPASLHSSRIKSINCCVESDNRCFFQNCKISTVPDNGCKCGKVFHKVCAELWNIFNFACSDECISKDDAPFDTSSFECHVKPCRVGSKQVFQTIDCTKCKNKVHELCNDIDASQTLCIQCVQNTLQSDDGDMMADKHDLFDDVHQHDQEEQKHDLLTPRFHGTHQRTLIFDQLHAHHYRSDYVT
jgi:hypothetical protein